MPSASATSPFAPPLKRSVTIAGHPTSISLEPIFWSALQAAADRRSLPLNALVAQIDAARIAAASTPNLASAVRAWVLADALGASDNDTVPETSENVSHYR